MSTLKLTLTAIDNKKFNIYADDYGLEESELPFANNSENSQFYAIINALNNTSDEYSHKTNDDIKNWMIEERFLKQNGNQLHEQMRENIGRKLYTALFPKTIEKALHQNCKSGEDLHIQIKYDFREIGKSNLSMYPWNLVHDGIDFLAKRQITFSYRIDYPDTPKPGKRQIDKLKVLVISSQAFENNQGQLQNQEPVISNSLKKAQDEGRACLLSWYEPQRQRPTFKVLREYFTDHYKEADKLPDIIHFNGHGVFQDKLGFLLFEDEQGQPDYISAEEFADLIEICNPKPQVIVITACKAALAHKSDSVFNGVAQKLLQQVPAVVATPFSISQESTTDFIDQIYRVLGNGRSSLLEAVKFASKAMKHKEYEWYRLVLFLRHNGDEDGYLFEVQETPQQLFNQNNRELEASDIETLKDLVKRCRIITSNRIVRENFCQYIGIEIDDISPDSVAGLGDNLFIETLLNYLQKTDNKSAFYKICVKIKPHFESSVKLTNKLQIIKSKVMQT
ncbi:CHAT domain-containing protein [Nostoc sp. FACHB-190]|uniref:CHAT domain-containing protein n=1 Tax=Nostoc sp. FACHB-190 TaxID=2692838 RepID=UPI001684F5D7|nr:CHAT domain-containing protein [Nostoc sp. FACHB-190]MBD2303029.1 CHAT domain-containing protein [Nostoc sp. FACHB-190]